MGIAKIAEQKSPINAEAELLQLKFSRPENFSYRKDWS
tara:strand:+ start:229 stop:342 length:114 start_codon:yes stop_codon:yes gene_type:complete